jgi:UDP-N-acetylglucosamine--N-acetylmuramyl-(pentapeptide) pyrophosphoryl-undecaprenol N-acetylglucosamine transferase
MTATQPYRLVISGGGTGGHIFPALAIAGEFRKRHPSSDILFVGARGKMEMKRVPEAGYKIYGLWISGFQRRLTPSNLLLPIKIVVSYFQARSLLLSFRPQVVVGTGGYASVPVMLAALRMRIPTLIQEQNSYPGLANRKMARWVNAICVGHEGMDRYFPAEKVRVTGNPVREDIFNLAEKRNRAFNYFGFSPSVKTLLVLGGSLGSRTINESIRQHIDKILDSGIQVIWQTGSLYYDEYDTWLKAYDRRKILLFDFLRDVDLAYAVADAVISRAGALAVSELCAAGKPSILVPSPNVAEDHQTANARVLADREAAILIRDDEAPSRLVNEAIRLLFDEQLSGKLARNAAAMARPLATQHIVDEIEKLMAIKSKTDVTEQLQTDSQKN